MLKGRGNAKRLFNLQTPPPRRPDAILGLWRNGFGVANSTSDRPFEKGDIVMIDTGAVYEGYTADIGRTVVIGGRPTDDQHRVHAALLKARMAIRAAIRPGVRASDVFCSGVEALDMARAAEAVTRLVGKAMIPSLIVPVPGLPKTKNGKIMRRAIRARYLGQPAGDMSALDASTPLELIPVQADTEQTA